jgi:hypothetical protein
MSAFDPASWLRRFEAAGGIYMVTSEPRIALSYPLDSPADPERCCSLLGELSGHPDHRAAVRQYLIGGP